MKKRIIQALLIAATCSGFAFGQAFVNVTEGKVNITQNSSVHGLNVFIGEGCQLINRGELTVYGLLANSSGTDGLVIKADEYGNGSLLHYTNGVQASVEQYLESERWHLVASPVTSSTIAPYMNIYLKEWKEPTSSWTYLSTPVTQPMSITKGYSAWADDDLTGNTTVTFDGTLVSSNMVVPGIEYTPGSSQQGYYMAGNPYPCALEWNENWIMIDLSGWAVVYDNGVYKGWNPFMPEGERSYNGKSNGYIASTQGFWVRAIGPDPLLMIPNSARAHKPDLFLKDEAVSNVQNIHLEVSANGYQDEMSILFLPDGTVGFDGLYELEKHYNVLEAPTFYSLSGQDMPMAVQVLPADWVHDSDNPVIPLGFEFGLEGECTITPTGMESFEPGQTAYLEDLHENVMHDLSYGPYVFVSNPMITPNRFLLHFGAVNNTTSRHKNEILIYSSGNSVYINLGSLQTGDAVVYDLLGKKICSFNLDQKLTRKMLPGTGYYVVSVISDKKVTNEKVFISN